MMGTRWPAWTDQGVHLDGNGNCVFTLTMNEDGKPVSSQLQTGYNFMDEPVKETAEYVPSFAVSEPTPTPAPAPTPSISLSVSEPEFTPYTPVTPVAPVKEQPVKVVTETKREPVKDAYDSYDDVIDFIKRKR
jgi:hypothetical protein